MTRPVTSRLRSGPVLIVSVQDERGYTDERGTSFAFLDSRLDKKGIRAVRGYVDGEATGRSGARGTCAADSVEQASRKAWRSVT